MANSFVEFETAADLKVAVEKLDNQDFKGSNVRCIADVCHPFSPTCWVPTDTTQTQDEVPRNGRYRSRSPPPRRTYSPAHGGYYNRSRDPLPGRDYSPPRHSGYRRRSPPPRHYDEYSRDVGRYRSPPPRAPPISYPDPAARYEDRGDPYAAPRRYEEAPYPTNGYPRRQRSPHRPYGGYDDRRYW